MRLPVCVLVACWPATQAALYPWPATMHPVRRGAAMLNLYNYYPNSTEQGVPRRSHTTPLTTPPRTYHARRPRSSATHVSPHHHRLCLSASPPLCAHQVPMVRMQRVNDATVQTPSATRQYFAEGAGILLS